MYKNTTISRGTSNLKDHPSHIHPTKYIPQKMNPTQLTLESTVGRQLCSEACSKRITDLIVEMTTLDMRPIRIVKCAG